MADVADGRFRPVSWTGAPLHRTGERAGPRLWAQALHGRDEAPLWGARPAACHLRVRGGRVVGSRFCDPRLGMAPSPPQGGAVRFSQRRALVRSDDGATWRQARDGSEAGLSAAIPRTKHSSAWRSAGASSGSAAMLSASWAVPSSGNV